MTGLGGTDFKRDTEIIMEAIADLLPAVARVRRTGSADELARTLPPDHSP